MKNNKLKSKLIGIAGDSATGKSTLSQIISEILCDDILILEGDAYHKWERGNEKWKKITHLNPKANFLYRQAHEIKFLKNGSKRKMIEYDHSCGKFIDKKIIYPKKFIIINGLHTLYLKKMRKLINLKVYMDSESNLKKFWKLKRDVILRHKNKENVLEDIEKRREDYYKYILPQIQYADIVIFYFDKNMREEYVDNLEYIPNISLKIFFNQYINVKELINLFDSYGIKLTYIFNKTLNRFEFTFSFEEYSFFNLSHELNEYMNINDNTREILKIVFSHIIKEEFMEEKC